MLFTAAFPGIERLNLRTALSGTLGKPIFVENDCNLGVIGERRRGVARGVDDAICVLASERLCAGIVVGGQLVRGHVGAAGEMAFLGAYEQHHGAEGIAQLARTLARETAHRASPNALVIADGIGGNIGDIEAETVFAAARAGDSAANAIIEESIRGAGRAIVTMALVLNPELVVIGGGVARAGDVLLDPLRRQLEQMARLPHDSKPPRSPSAGRSSARSATRSTKSSHGCSTDSIRRREQPAADREIQADARRA